MILEKKETLTINTMENIQTEESSLSKAVLQNWMSLDLLTAKEGEVCVFINISCCAYNNKDRQVEADSNMLWEKTWVFHEVSLVDTSFGFEIFGIK